MNKILRISQYAPAKSCLATQCIACKTLTLYQEILGFELVDAEVLKGTLAGMLVLKVKANDYLMTLTITPPQLKHSLGPIGNTNHNHFILKVNDIATIGDKLM